LHYNKKANDLVYKKDARASCVKRLLQMILWRRKNTVGGGWIRWLEKLFLMIFF